MSKFDFGVLLESNWTVERDVELAIAADRSGYDSVWANGNVFGRDPVTVLALLATQTQRVRLGTNVINAFIRHPILIASSAATLNDASKGRCILGFGSAYPDVLNRIGIEGERPLTRVKEAIGLVRSLLAGESVTFKGVEFAMNDAKLRFEPKVRIPIYLGLGEGPRMQRLAGELCDGAIISEAIDEQYKRQVGQVRKGLALAKRNPADFPIVMNSMVSVAKKREDAVNALRPSVAARLGRKATSEGRFGVDDETIRKYVAEPRSIPVDYIQHLAIAGTPDDCVGRINELRKIGITGVAHRHPTVELVRGVQELLLPMLS